MFSWAHLFTGVAFNLLNRSFKHTAIVVANKVKCYELVCIRFYQLASYNVVSHSPKQSFKPVDQFFKKGF